MQLSRVKIVQGIKTTLITALLFFPAFTSAVSLSTYRIYLDRQHRDYDFIVSNRNEVEQKCKLAIVHYNMDEKGVPQLVLGDNLPENSATTLIRYSPRNFTLDAFASQAVKFRMRNKKGLTAKEYRSFLSVNCQQVIAEDESDSNTSARFASISFKPQLVHHVPIIVRPIKLKTQVEITNVTVEKNRQRVSFMLSRLGERSIFADIELINKATNERLDLAKNITVYPENNSKTIKLNTKGIAIDKLLIRLTEDKRTGGDLILNKNVINDN